MKRPDSRKAIYINGRFLNQPATGVQRYAYELVRAWDRLLEQGEIDASAWRLEILTPRLTRTIPQFKHIFVRQVGWQAGNLWEQMDLPWYSRGQFLFNPCNTAPVCKWGQAATIHDASVFAVPNSYSLAFQFKYKLILWVLFRTGRLILTDSNYSKDELVKYCRADPGKLHVVALASDHILDSVPDENVFQKHGIGQKPYFLAVGSNAPHKNLTMLAQALDQITDPGFEVVIAGGDFKSVFQSTGLSSQDHLKRIGYVTEEELKSLYQHAQALVFPSLYEGFGLPPLEAMACGCPVICARAASLPEVCGEAALYFDPRRAQNLAEKMVKLNLDPLLQADLREKGLKQAMKFSWDRTARQTWEFLAKN